MGLSTLDKIGAQAERRGIEKRPLGKTGLEVTILGLGCVAIGYGPHTTAEGAKIVEACIDAGINYIDCASSYGNTPHPFIPSPNLGEETELRGLLYL